MTAVNEQEFAFRLGYMIGFIGGSEGKSYLLKHNVKQVDIDNFHTAGFKIAEAFYKYDGEPMTMEGVNVDTLARGEEVRAVWCDEDQSDGRNL